MANYVNNIVYSIAPSQNQIGVPVTSPVVLVFNENMNAQSLNKETISLTRGATVIDATYSYNGIRKELTITPKEKLVSDQTYKVTILTGEAGPQTVFGNLSSKSYLFYFTTELIVPEPEIPKDSEENPKDDVPDVDNFPIEEDSLFSVVSIVDSYPKEGDLVGDLPAVVLSFDRDVQTTDILQKIYLREKSISPLLSRLNNTNRINFLLNTESDARTISLSPLTPLKKGMAYELVVEAGISDSLNPLITLGMDVVIGFQTQWEIFYSSVSAVKLVLGLFREAYTDAEIASMIYQESLAVYQLMSMKPEFDLLLWGAGAPYAATQYVLYRTAYQAILGQVIENSSGMKKSIKLGDLSVAESSSVSSEITDLIGLFEAEMKKWWNLLNGIEETEDGVALPKLSKKLGSATRGITDNPYPEFVTRVPFTDLGG